MEADLSEDFDLYEFPKGYDGRKTYVSVRGHARSVPVIHTYKGCDGRNYILPDCGGDYSGLALGGGSAMIMRDIGEYTSVVDGSRISSRSQHREHIRAHGLIEIGNERFPQRTENAPTGIGKDIKRSIEQLKARA